MTETPASKLTEVTDYECPLDDFTGTASEVHAHIEEAHGTPAEPVMTGWHKQ